jgi:O-Antigen ligase
MRQALVGGAWLSAAAVALMGFALLGSQGSSTSRLFWIGLLAIVVVSVGLILQPPELGRPALAFLGLLTAFAVWQALTILWSIQPASSWDYANRALVYAAFAFLGVLVGSALPRTWIAAGLGALLTLVLLVALAAKVIPGLYDDYGRLARLRWPLAYWNELALVAAVTVPLGLWLAGRRDRPLRARVAGVFHVYVALVAVVLTFSRFGIFLAVVGAVAWVWLDRERLDALVALLIAAPVAAIVAGDALLLPGIADDHQSHHTRVHDGLIFGLLFVGGVAVVIELSRRLLAREGDVRLRRRIAIVGGWAALGVCVVALIVLVVRAGGPADFVRARWDEFAHAQSSGTPGRLTSTSSGNRWAWWQQAWDAFTRHPGGGTGAGSFSLTSTVSAHNAQQSTVEPHNTPLQFLTETGIVGFLLYAGVIASVAVAVKRGRRDRATRVLALVLAIGWLHSVLDIDWNFVATQGPLFAVAGVLVSQPGRATRLRLLSAAGVAVCALAALYSMFAPWYSDQRLQDAYSALERADLVDTAGAARDAHNLDPLALEPIQLLATTLYRAQDFANAERYYRLETKRESQNPETWYDLGVFYSLRHEWRRAYDALNHSYTLDAFGPAAQTGGYLDQARCKVFPASRQCPAAAPGASP